MFRVVSIKGVANEDFDEECFKVEEAFFFTIKIPSYYIIYNKNEDILGIIPTNYNLFFKVDEWNDFEDIDMENILRLFDAGDDFYLVGTKDASKKIKLIPSREIAEFKLIEDDPIQIPFTNKAFDSEGVVVFRNMTSLVESIMAQNTF